MCATRCLALLAKFLMLFANVAQGQLEVNPQLLMFSLRYSRGQTIFNDMDNAFRPLVQALTAAADAILAISPSSAQSLLEIHGWNQPALNLDELSGFARRLAADIEDFGIDDVADEIKTMLGTYTERIKQLQASTFPQIWGGNGPQAISSYLATLNGMREELRPVLQRDRPVDPRATVRLAKRVARMSAELDQVLLDRASLERRVHEINEAREAALSLPEDLESLREAREQIHTLTEEARHDAEKIDQLERGAVESTMMIDRLAREAEKLVAKCEEAYRVTTTMNHTGFRGGCLV
jgi:methyl-accepting chemotaxis protein